MGSRGANTDDAIDLRRRVTLGRTGLHVSRLGIASSYGVGAEAVQAAYHDHGVNYLYWGTFRRKGFGRGLRKLARSHRDDLVIMLQTYSRLGKLMRPSVTRALRHLQIDFADILLLGLFNRPPRPGLIDAAHKLRDEGLVHHLAVSCHRRATFVRYIDDEVFDPIMFRYNAAHRGAEREIFPHLAREQRPGTVSYTATRWGHLLDPRRLPPEEPKPRGSDCYRFVLSQPVVDVCLTGPANAEQLAEALCALERGPMDEQELAWMHRVGDYVYRRPLGRGLRNRLRRIGGND